MQRYKLKQINGGAIPAPLIALALTACGGGDGSSATNNAPTPTTPTILPPPTPPTPTVPLTTPPPSSLIPLNFTSPIPTPPTDPTTPHSFTGRVYDGPVMGAHVYIDVNDNGQINENDISLGITDNTGFYSGEALGIHYDKPLIVDLNGATDLGINLYDDADDTIFAQNTVWRAPSGSVTISPLTNFIENGGAPEIIQHLLANTDITKFDPYSQAEIDPIIAEQTLAFGRAFINVTGNELPPIIELNLQIYELHPLHKPLLNMGENTNATLTDEYGDNALFVITDNKIYWRNRDSLPDFESPTDANIDNIYEIEVTQMTDTQTITTQASITVQDVEIEQSLTNRFDFNHHPPYDGYNFIDIKNNLPDDEFAPNILSGLYYETPKTGPLTLTWSIITDKSITLAPSDPQYLIDRYQESIDNLTLAPMEQNHIDYYRAHLEAAFTMFERAANLKFVEVDDSEDNVGDIRISIYSDLNTDFDGLRGLAFYPNEQGSVTLDIDNGILNDKITWHEIGHALGLKHPFEPAPDDIQNPDTIPPDMQSLDMLLIDDHFPFDEDHLFSLLSIMSYSNRDEHYVPAGIALNGLLSADVAALQFVYGAPGTDDEGIGSILDIA